MGDNYKAGEIKDALDKAKLRWPYEFSRVGLGRDGSRDVRAAQRLVIGGKLKMRETLSLAEAIRNSAIRRDSNGNSALDQSTARGRIDLLSAVVIASVRLFSLSWLGFFAAGPKRHLDPRDSEKREQAIRR